MTNHWHHFAILGVLIASAFLGSLSQPHIVPRAVVPLAQGSSASAGQTCVAMCLNSVTGQTLNDEQINEKYGFALLKALNVESEPLNLHWIDAGDLSDSSWERIDRKVNIEKLPVIVALNGPEFSPSGRGHIVTVIKTVGPVVTLADPASGRLRQTTKQLMNQASKHPDGNFVFLAEPWQFDDQVEQQPTL